jgi:5S rRNA maturation endonuclease (ribonuclease M5)
MKNISYREAKQISISEYLKKLGFSPDYIRGGDYWYCSPLREEKHASFKVNTKLNLWYDHGTGEGGTMIDLGIRLHECSVEELLTKLSGDGVLFSFQQHKRIDHSNYPKPNKEEEGKIIIDKVAELKSLALTSYLNQRGISMETAKRYCREVSFSINDKSYSAVGFENRSSGYELRNNWFKGSSSPKDISFIGNGSNSVCLLEGFMDFLSLLELKDQVNPNANFLVLNSVALLPRSLEILRAHMNVFLFLDHDKAGQETAEKLTACGIRFINASHFYKDFKDVNECLVSLQLGQENRQVRRR